MTSAHSSDSSERKEPEGKPPYKLPDEGMQNIVERRARENAESFSRELLKKAGLGGAFAAGKELFEQGQKFWEILTDTS